MTLTNIHQNFQSFQKDENPKSLIPAYDERNKKKRTKQRNKSRIKFKEINKLRKKESKIKENEETPSKMA